MTEQKREKGKFVKELTDEDILAAFPEPNHFYTAGYLAKKLGVDRRTARSYVTDLMCKTDDNTIIVEVVDESTLVFARKQKKVKTNDVQED